MAIRKQQDKSVLWVEKYRPQTLAECLLPESYRKIFQGFIDRDEMPNLLLFGSTGIGKTSIAQALINDMQRDSMTINATITPNVETVRERVVDYASSGGLFGEKTVIFDEADYLNKLHTQPALSHCIEKFSRCRYVLTCNEPKKIISRLKSRLMEFDFNYTEEENLELLTAYADRACEILEKEQISYQRDDVEEIVEYYFPDYRKTLNELHRSSVTGTLLPMRKAA